MQIFAINWPFALLWIKSNLISRNTFLTLLVDFGIKYEFLFYEKVVVKHNFQQNFKDFYRWKTGFEQKKSSLDSESPFGNCWWLSEFHFIIQEWFSFFKRTFQLKNPSFQIFEQFLWTPFCLLFLSFFFKYFLGRIFQFQKKFISRKNIRSYLFKMVQTFT